jgi:hypothetical protein
LHLAPALPKQRSLQSLSQLVSIVHFSRRRGFWGRRWLEERV